MERKGTPLKIFSMVDMSLSVVSIIYGLVLIIPPLTDYFFDQKTEMDDQESEDPPPGPILHFDSRLTLAVYVSIIIIGVIMTHSVQAFMAVVLFSASRKILVEPLRTTRKFKFYLIWSVIFLLFLVIISITYTALVFYFINWLILAFLIIQIVFRLYAIYYVQSCRNEIRKQFLQSEVPWISPSLPMTL